MLTNDFKSKARNIAFKSFLCEIKKNDLYFGTLKKIASFLISRDTKNHKFYSGGFVNLNVMYVNPQNRLMSLIAPEINNCLKNFKTQREYDYLMHCVNTLIRMFLEPILQKKEIPIENVGRRIFTRAAKKVFGKDTVIETPQNNGRMSNDNITNVNLHEIVSEAGITLTDEQLIGEILARWRAEHEPIDPLGLF